MSELTAICEWCRYKGKVMYSVSNVAANTQHFFDHPECLYEWSYLQKRAVRPVQPSTARRAATRGPDADGEGV